jgi:hypothetical protein
MILTLDFFLNFLHPNPSDNIDNLIKNFLLCYAGLVEPLPVF